MNEINECRKTKLDKKRKKKRIQYQSVSSSFPELSRALKEA